MPPALSVVSRTRHRYSHLLLATLGLATAACGSSPAAPKTGSLAVAVTAPTSVTPNVSVTGPAGYAKTITATTTLTGLTTGSYTVTAASVAGSNAIVATMSTAVVTGSPATVGVGSPDTVTVMYATRAGSGGLWLANANNANVLDYTAMQLAATTGNAPATAFATGLPSNAWGVAFDANGNLWVTGFRNDSILEFSAAQLAKSGSPIPGVAIYDSLAGHSGPGQPLAIAFDANGNLWVSDLSDNAIEKYSTSQLSASGRPTPAVVLTASASSLSSPSGIAFDSAGDLWVANVFNSTIVEFTADQLDTSGSPTPAVTLSQDAADSSIFGPLYIAFDGSGNLWVGNGNDPYTGPNTVVAFSPSQLATSGSPVPAIILRPTGGSTYGPGGLAFDASGNLWVANFYGNTVVQFAASQLISSGSPTPNVTISGSSLSEPMGLAFDPHASALPIKPALRAARKTR